MAQNDRLKLIYNTTLSQVISSCGEYLFAGNNYGDIFVFRLEFFLGSNFNFKKF